MQTLHCFKCGKEFSRGTFEDKVQLIFVSLCEECSKYNHAKVMNSKAYQECLERDNGPKVKFIPIDDK